MTNTLSPTNMKYLLHEITAQVLFTGVKRARVCQMYQTLHPSDQATVLEEAWPELFLLTASYWPVDLGVLLLRWTAIHDDGFQVRHYCTN